MMAIEEHAFREIMSGFPAGVTVVTATDSNGLPHGLTVTAFCSVSLKPPLVLVCLERGTTTLPAVRDSGGFTVNFLARGHDDISVRFADREVDRFAGLDWEPPQHAFAGPVLTTVAIAAIECRLDQMVEAGDHWVLVGEVVRGVQVGGEPLVHWQRRYLELRT